MKKATAILLSAILMIGMTATAFAADWQDAYSAKMDELAVNDMYPEAEGPWGSWDRVSFYDIDDNGIPEMFYNGTVYSVENGNAKKVGSGNFSYVVPANDSILLSHVQQDMFGEWWMAEVKLENGKLAPQHEDIMKNGKVVVSPEKLFAYADYDHQKYMLKGRRVNNDSELWKQVEKQAVWLEDTYAYSVRKSSKPLTTFVQARVEQASPSQQKITVNGKRVNVTGYLIDGSNYCKLRDVAYMLKDTDSSFDVAWDNARKKVLIQTEKSYQGDLKQQKMVKKQATAVYDGILCDGVQYQAKAYLIDGNNYFKLRDLMELVDAEITWNNTTSTVEIHTGN